jgi:hypothetical protein
VAFFEGSTVRGGGTGGGASFEYSKILLRYPVHTIVNWDIERTEMGRELPLVVVDNPFGILAEKPRLRINSTYNTVHHAPELFLSFHYDMIAIQPYH